MTFKCLLSGARNIYGMQYNDDSEIQINGVDIFTITLKGLLLDVGM